MTIKRKAGFAGPRISTNEKDEALVDYLRQNSFDSARVAKIITDYPGSRSTACRRIKLSDIQNRVAVQKQILSKENK